MGQCPTKVKTLTTGEARSIVARVTLWRLPLLSDLTGLAHLFVGRLDTPRPGPASLIPLLRPGATLPLRTVRQVHSSRCIEVPAPADGEAGEADALVTTLRGQALGIATADCLPVIACDAEAGVLSVVHAGWRGTLAGVLDSALDAMTGRCGARPEAIRVGVGPGVGRCCYVVGREVQEAFAQARPGHAASIFARAADGSLHLDLLEANRLAAMERGIRPEHFAALEVCTVCRADLCHSYRVAGPAAGRMWLLAALI